MSDYINNTLEVLIKAFEECKKTDREGYNLAKELLEKRKSKVEDNYEHKY